MLCGDNNSNEVVVNSQQKSRLSSSSSSSSGITKVDVRKLNNFFESILCLDSYECHSFSCYPYIVSKFYGFQFMNIIWYNMYM